MKNKINKESIPYFSSRLAQLIMSVVTKIILDTAEYNRLLSIEKAYKELKAEKAAETNQSGSGTSSKSCSCLANDTKCSCKPTPPLSEIIATNEQARSVDVPPRGILPSITDPNEQGYGTQSKSNPIQHEEKEHFNPLISAPLRMSQIIGIFLVTLKKIKILP